jgi:2-hydroxy-3-oxopropionate reductase
MTDVGFIGLGIMGRPMAEHVANAGHRLFVHNRSPIAPSLLGLGASNCQTAEDVARHAEVIITILPDTPDVEAVLFGASGVAAGLSQGKVVVDMSSISPIETRMFSSRIAELGCDYLDAPVSGGEVGAKQGKLTIMVGGAEPVFERVLPILKTMGHNITLIGGSGDGQTAKVANQIIVALTIEAVAEALTFSARAGADPGKVRSALMGGFANSRVLEVHGERMVQRRFEPGFRIKLHKKDLNLALQGAASMGISLPNTAMTQQLFNVASGNGGDSWDHSGLVKVIELLAGQRSLEETA